MDSFTHHVVPRTDDEFLFSFISGSALLIVSLCRKTDRQWDRTSYMDISLIRVSVFEGSDLQVLDSPVFLRQLVLQSLNIRSHSCRLLTRIQSFDHLRTHGSCNRIKNKSRALIYHHTQMTDTIVMLMIFRNDRLQSTGEHHIIILKHYNL